MASIGRLHGLTAALALIAVPASALSAKPRAPIGNWVVDYADSQCTALRTYGSVEKPLFLLFKPAPTGEVMQVAIIRGGNWSSSMQVDAKLSVDQGKAIDISMLAFNATKEKRRINLINLTLARFEAVRRAKALSIYAPGEVRESFALSGMAPMMRAIDDCLTDLQRVWNVGAAHSGLIKAGGEPTANLSSYFTSDDYPDVALGADQSGTVRLALLIDQTGKIADCTVVGTSGVATLDAQSCAVLTDRAKFTPAVGTDGKPVKSATIRRIRWELE